MFSKLKSKPKSTSKRVGLSRIRAGLGAIPSRNHHHHHHHQDLAEFSRVYILSVCLVFRLRFLPSLSLSPSRPSPSRSRPQNLRILSFPLSLSAATRAPSRLREPRPQNHLPLSPSPSLPLSLSRSRPLERSFVSLSLLRLPFLASVASNFQRSPNFKGARELQTSLHFLAMPTQSWFPSSLLGSSSASRPSTPTSSSSMGTYRPSDWPPSPSTGLHSPAEAAGIISRLKDKSIDELRKLLTDKNAYEAFFNSLEQVEDQNNLRQELWEETLQLARENLEKETRISELRNQCRIIRTTELAAAQEKLKELEKQKDEILRFYSPLSMLQNLQDSMNKTEVESEILHNRLLEKDIDLATFLQKYKKLRNAYHRRALTHLAAKTSVM